MATIQKKVYIITEQQRDALIEYLQNRPFREVAAGVQFLINAPSANLNTEVPDEESADIDTEQTKQPKSALQEVSLLPEKLAILTQP
ncbi:hypothetical protein H6G93_36575 [Nostoc sp. FACHB-973]|nr:hypothetical protein [Nostoc sp. FACHB-973]